MPNNDTIHPSALTATGHLIVHTPECAAQHFAPWMIEERWFRSAVDAVKSGTLRPRAMSDDGPDEPPPPPYTAHNGVAVVQIAGPIMKKSSKFGGTSSVATRKAIRQAVADDNVHSILLHIDSPGGTVAGTGDLATDIAVANEQKPVYAHIDDLGASAAYWVASQAQRVTANPTAEVGSIGTLLVLEDTSGQYAAAGVKVHVISTGKYKGAGVDGAPVTDEHLAAFQTEVDDLNEHFLKGVSKGRSMTIGAVRQIADGRVHIASKAKALGLIDDVSSLDGAVSAIQKDYRQRVAAAFAPSAPPVQSTDNPAPEASPRGEAPSAVSKEHPMPDPVPAPQQPTTNPAPPAQTPAAAAPPPVLSQGDLPQLHPIGSVAAELANFRAIQGPRFFEDGRKKGIEEANAAHGERIRAIVAVCAGKPDMALNAILAGQNPEAVKLAYDSLVTAETIAREESQKKDVEILRLQSLLVLGGHPGVPMGLETGGGDPEAAPEQIADPKAHAEREWDFKPSVRRGFTSKDRYVAIRVAELSGKFQAYSENSNRHQASGA